jgi:hypothetical protein
MASKTNGGDDPLLEHSQNAEKNHATLWRRRKSPGSASCRSAVARDSRPVFIKGSCVEPRGHSLSLKYSLGIRRLPSQQEVAHAAAPRPGGSAGPDPARAQGHSQSRPAAVPSVMALAAAPPAGLPPGRWPADRPLLKQM